MPGPFRYESDETEEFRHCRACRRPVGSSGWCRFCTANNRVFLAICVALSAPFAGIGVILFGSSFGLANRGWTPIVVAQALCFCPLFYGILRTYWKGPRGG